VPLSQQSDHELLDHVFLPNDYPLNLSDGVPEELRGCLISELARCPSSRALLDRLTKRRTTHSLSLFSSMSIYGDGHVNRPALFAGPRAILADAGLQAMSLDKPNAMSEPIASCEND
jgi:hypothetical protein